jgi:undecaprenyl-diphosphatase
MALVETQTRFSGVTTFAHARWWYLWLLAAAALLALAFWFDSTVLRWMTDHQTPGARAFMRNVSWWGDWPAHVLAGVVGAGAAYALRSRRWLAVCAAMVIACAVAGTVNRVIKIAAGRSRPSVQVDAGWNGPRFSSKYHAFPSGHTAASTAFFAALCVARPGVGWLFVPIPLLIGFSRLYVGAHHLSDVIFAVILGVTCAVFITPYVRRRIDPGARQPQTT